MELCPDVGDKEESRSNHVKKGPGRNKNESQRFREYDKGDPGKDPRPRTRGEGQRAHAFNRQGMEEGGPTRHLGASWAVMKKKYLPSEVENTGQLHIYLLDDATKKERKGSFPFQGNKEDKTVSRNLEEVPTGTRVTTSRDGLADNSILGP